MNNIAVLLSDQDNYNDAEILYEKVFLGFSNTFGFEHAETKRAKNNLALLQKKKNSLLLIKEINHNEISEFSKDQNIFKQNVEFVIDKVLVPTDTIVTQEGKKNKIVKARGRESGWIANLKKKIKR